MDILLPSIHISLIHLLACRACCAPYFVRLQVPSSLCRKVGSLCHKVYLSITRVSMAAKDDGEMTCSRGRTYFVTVRIPFWYVHRYEIHIYGPNKRNFYYLLVSLSPMNIAGIILDLWWRRRGLMLVSVCFVVPKWDLLAEMLPEMIQFVLIPSTYCSLACQLNVLSIYRSRSIHSNCFSCTSKWHHNCPKHFYNLQSDRSKQLCIYCLVRIRICGTRHHGDGSLSRTIRDSNTFDIASIFI